MTEEQMKDHALQLAAAYGWLIQDMNTRKHDVDAHNLCSAVVERGGIIQGVFFSYSNPSALPKTLLSSYEFIKGDVLNKLINRGGMQDLHTEVRLINHLYHNRMLEESTVVSFFSSRSVCPTCRKAIMETMQRLAGKVAFMAYEFKAELHGSVTETVYPILQDRNAAQAAIQYA